MEAVITADYSEECCDAEFRNLTVKPGQKPVVSAANRSEIFRSSLRRDRG